MADEYGAPLTSAEFVAAFVPLQQQYIDGEVTEAEYATALEPLFAGWGQGGAFLATYTLLLTRLANFDSTMTAMVADWYSGTADGGPDPAKPGEYPLLTASQEIYWVPSPAKLAGVMEKGDPGRDASWGVAFFIQFGLGISEYYFAYIMGEAGTFDVAKSKVYARVAPTSNRIHKILKNGADWGTINWVAGQNLGTVVIASPTVAAGDVLLWQSSTAQDPTLADLAINLVGVINP